MTDKTDDHERRLALVRRVKSAPTKTMPPKRSDSSPARDRSDTGSDITSKPTAFTVGEMLMLVTFLAIVTLIAHGFLSLLFALWPAPVLSHARIGMDLVGVTLVILAVANTSFRPAPVVRQRIGTDRQNRTPDEEAALEAAEKDPWRSIRSRGSHVTGIVSKITETRIDAMMVGELRCNPKLADWLASSAGFPGARMIKVLDSVWDDGRETDLLVVYTNPSVALLIENKVTASLSTGQAHHYRVRGQLGIRRGDWARYKTVIFTPSAWHLMGRNSSHGFDHVVTYEQVANVIGAESQRTAFNRDLLLQGCAKCSGKS